jgi:hypothetical protein
MPFWLFFLLSCSYRHSMSKFSRSSPEDNSSFCQFGHHIGFNPPQLYFSYFSWIISKTGSTIQDSVYYLKVALQTKKESNLSFRRPYPDGASLRYQNFVHWRSGDHDGAATQESVIKSHCPEAIIGDHFVTFRSRSTFNMECLSRALVTRLTTSAVLSGRIVKDGNLHWKSARRIKFDRSLSSWL